MCDKNCSKTSCPFAYTEESETIQNYGCLPTPIDIISMRVNYGKTWACHSNIRKPCLGALQWLRDRGLEYRVNSPLVTEDDNWSKWTDKGIEFIQPKLDEYDSKRFFL